jgi:hypothetical protein
MVLPKSSKNPRAWSAGLNGTTLSDHREPRDIAKESVDRASEADKLVVQVSFSEEPTNDIFGDCPPFEHG